MARDANAPDIPWPILETYDTFGIGGHRFDAQRQSGTLGPQPMEPDRGPDETEGEPGAAPSGT